MNNPFEVPQEYQQIQQPNQANPDQQNITDELCMSARKPERRGESPKPFKRQREARSPHSPRLYQFGSDKDADGIISVASLPSLHEARKRSKRTKRAWTKVQNDKKEISLLFMNQNPGNNQVGQIDVSNKRQSIIKSREVYLDIQITPSDNQSDRTIKDDRVDREPRIMSVRNLLSEKSTKTPNEPTVNAQNIKKLETMRASTARLQLMMANSDQQLNKTAARVPYTQGRRTLSNYTQFQIIGPSFPRPTMAQLGTGTSRPIDKPLQNKKQVINNNIKNLSNLKTERIKNKMNKNHQKYLTANQQQRDSFMARLSQQVNSGAQEYSTKQTNFSQVNKYNKAQATASGPRPIGFGKGPKQPGSNSKIMGPPGYQNQQKTSEFAVKAEEPQVITIGQDDLNFMDIRKQQSEQMPYDDDENIPITDRNNAQISARHFSRMMATNQHNRLERQAEPERELYYSTQFEQLQEAQEPVVSNSNLGLNHEDSIQFQGDTQAPLTDDDADEEVALSSINPTSSLNQDQTDEQIKNSIPKRKRQSQLYKESVVSAGYDADNDPYTQLRNERKKKGKNIQIDLQESIIKVEELNRVILEHNKLISPKQKTKEKLSEQMVVCDIEVQPDIPFVRRVEVELNDSGEDEDFQIQLNRQQLQIQPRHTTERNKIQYQIQPRDFIQSHGGNDSKIKEKKIEKKTSPKKKIEQKKKIPTPFEKIQMMRPDERRLHQIRAVVMMQKWVRGHQARKLGKKQREINFKYMRKLRRLLSVAYGRLRTKMLKNIVQGLKEAGNLHADQNYQLWQKYKTHCATMIQKSWKGYHLRYIQIDEFSTKVWRNKRYRLINSLFKGFKTRLLLSPNGYNKALHTIRNEIFKITGQNQGSKAMIIDVNDKITLKNLMKKRRLKVVELIRQFQKIYHTQGIIVSLLRAKRKHDREAERKSQKKKKLTESKTKVNIDVNMDDDDNSRLSDSDNDAKIKDPPASFWPSQQQAEENNEILQTATFWPSLQQSKPDSPKEESKTWWPSQNENKKKSSPRQSKIKKEVFLETFSNQDKNEEEDIDWLSMPVKKTSSSKKKDDPIDLDDRPIRPAKNSYVNIDDMPVGGNKNQSPFNIDEMPIGGLRNTQNRGNIDEMPVGVHKRGIDTNSPEAGKLSFGIREPGSGPSNHGDGNIGSPFRTSRADEQPPPSYDFEKMIEEAMSKGENAPAVRSLSNNKVRNDGDSKGVVEEVDGKKTPRKKPDAQKQQLLQKRKAYDPRAAIKNQKKGENKSSLSVADQMEKDKGGRSRSHLREKSAMSHLSDLSGNDLSKALPEEETKIEDSPELPEKKVTPKPFLKRKTKAVVVAKEPAKKPEGKSRIDCWHRDKDTNTIIYGNKQENKMPRKSLLKKNQSKQLNQNQQQNMPIGQTAQIGAAVSISQKQMQMSNQNNLYVDMSQIKQPRQSRVPLINLEESEPESAIPDENDLVSQPNNLNFYADIDNQMNVTIPQGKMNVDELEHLFNQLHGPDYFLKDEFQTERFATVTNPGEKRQKQKELLDVRKLMTSHDFKYSMIPFSDYNNSVDVNLYTPQSKIPYLYKNEVAETPSIRQNEPNEPSLFFKCYSDDIYEAILEDVRAHYLAISNQDLADFDENDGNENEQFPNID